jgi:hypothetical protein
MKGAPPQLKLLSVLVLVVGLSNTMIIQMKEAGTSGTILLSGPIRTQRHARTRAVPPNLFDFGL